MEFVPGRQINSIFINIQLIPTLNTFLSGTGLVSVQSSSSYSSSDGKAKPSTPVSPEMSKFLKDSNAIPYWSPATQRDHESKPSGLSQLAVSAKEFVPSNSSGEDAYNTRGLNSTANEWVPSKGVSNEYGTENPVDSTGSGNEEMVEVNMLISCFSVCQW